MEETYSDGIGMDTQNTTEHQGCQKEIAFGLIAAHPTFCNKLATETNVFEDDSPIKRAPDISFWKTYKKKSRGCYIKTGLLMTIEITHTYKNFDYSEKSIIEIFSLIDSVRESFIYDYEKDEWTRYRRMSNGEIKKSEKSSYSEVIKEDLAQFI